MNFTEEHQLSSCVHSNVSCLGTSATVGNVLQFICTAVVVTVTVSGNLLVIISICHFKQLQTPTTSLLLSLSMTDLLVGVIVIPLDFTMALDPQQCFSSLFCTVYTVAAYFLTCISIYNVALIAVDRYFALSSPFQYSLKMTLNVTLRVIATLWFYGVMYNVLLLYFNGNISGMKTNVTCGECIVSVDSEGSIIDFVIVFVLPCSIIIVIYLKIFAIAKKQAKKIRSVRKFSKANNDNMASERKAAKTLGILVAVFLLCLVPFYISVFLSFYIRASSLDLVVSVTEILLYLNSSINPIIYALFYPWFQNAVKLIITFKICGTESSSLNVHEQKNSE